MIHFMGDSHAAIHLRRAAEERGNKITQALEDADVVFVSEDTPTDLHGNRNLDKIKALVLQACQHGAQIVLTSQVPPGFTRGLNINNIYHQAETLRIKDAEYRALNPEYIAVGGPQGICREYSEYLMSFHCPILRMSWEEAEFSKIAVNMFLAAQVERTNLLAEVCKKVGADWNQVKKALQNDSRIGKDAYLTPGRWEDSKHLYRDFVTLEALRTS